MANYGLFIGWNRSIPGKEHMALELFQSAVGYWTKQRDAGNIESFEPIILTPHGTMLNGCIVVRGERQRVDNARWSEEFMDILTRVGLCVDGLSVVPCYIGEGVQMQLNRVKKHLTK
ncbi:MAG: hypothetical protein IT371_00265 [Deltaproteobacteria bacterium]|nr:hypothetical protein [Deltaproteobacteria bacterium]